MLRILRFVPRGRQVRGLAGVPGVSHEEAYRALLRETSPSPHAGSGELERVLERPDPLFAEHEPVSVIRRLRETPEPLRTRLVQRMVLSMTPEEVLDLSKYDERIGELLRTAHAARGGEDGDVGVDGGADGEQESWLLDNERFATELQERPPRTPYASNVQYDSRYFVEESNPVLHSEDAVGRVYPLPELDSIFPEGTPGGMEEEFERTGRQALLVRSLGYKLKSELEEFRRSSETHFTEHLNWEQSWRSEEERMEEEVRAGHAAGRTWATSMAEAGPLARWHTSVESQQSDAPKIWPARLLHGPRGIGKSCVLGYLVHYARSSGWLTLHIPDSFWLMRDGQSLTASTTRPGFVDQNDLSAAILSAVILSHGDQLANIPQRRRYAREKYLPSEEDAVWTAEAADRKAAEARESARREARAQAGGEDAEEEEGDVFGGHGMSVEEEAKLMDHDRSAYTLRHLVEWGIAHPESATDAVVDLLQELRLVTEYPVLLAVDGINELYEDSYYPFAGKMPWPTTRLSLPRALHVWRRQGARGFRGEDASGFDASMHSMKRGTIIGTTTLAHRKRLRIFERADPPRGMIKTVSRLDRHETHSLLLHYHYTGLFPVIGDRSQVDSHAVDYFRTLSSGIPRALRDATQIPPVN